jgi:oligopeptide transport system permease protein
VSEAVGVINPIAFYWWMLLFPSGFLAVTLLSLNYVGDGLRDAVDPKGR